MKLFRKSKTKMGDHLYMTIGDEEIVGGGRVIIKDSSPLSKRDILIFEVVEEDERE